MRGEGKGKRKEEKERGKEKGKGKIFKHWHLSSREDVNSEHGSLGDGVAFQHLPSSYFVPTSAELRMW